MSAITLNSTVTARAGILTTASARAQKGNHGKVVVGWPGKGNKNAIEAYAETYAIATDTDVLTTLARFTGDVLVHGRLRLSTTLTLMIAMQVKSCMISDDRAQP